MPRDSIEQPADALADLLARVANIPRSKSLERARQANAAAIALVDKCHHEFVRHTQRLHKADKQSLDTVATQAEAALADAQLAHRQSIMAMDKARADHAPRLQEHVDSTAGEIVAALADALATVDRIATALSAVAQTVERDGGSLPPVLRSAYSARAMCRHVAGMIKI